MTPEPEPAAAACPLCQCPLADDDPRCPSCGLYRGLGEGRGFSRQGILLFFGTIVALYLVVLVIVLLAR
ncbi:MAG: hypothetical protein JWL73_3616 [Actinomycetia bacterium]|nr:hypothetical protein [Actinomycetes bacterium]